MLRDFVRSYYKRDYAYDYWHFPHKVSQEFSKGGYFIDFGPKGDYAGPFDAEGIPLLDLATQHWSGERRLVYSPIVIAQYGLGWHTRWMRTGDAGGRAKLLVAAEWLRSAAESVHVGGDTLALFRFDIGGVSTTSAMAQGLAASVWARAFELTGDSGFLTATANVLRTFNYTLEQGGVVDTHRGMALLEEYSYERSHVLNGHIYALMGLYDYRRVSAEARTSAELETLWLRHVESALVLAAGADLGFWSRYSWAHTLTPNIASCFYHEMHSEMLDALATVSGRPEFRRIADRWRRYRGNVVFCTAAMIAKLVNWMELYLRGRVSRLLRPVRA